MICTWFLKNWFSKMDSNKLHFWSMIFTTCVACKFQVRNRNGVHRNPFFKINKSPWFFLWKFPKSNARKRDILIHTSLFFLLLWVLADEWFSISLVIVEKLLCPFWWGFFCWTSVTSCLLLNTKSFEESLLMAYFY